MAEDRVAVARQRCRVAEAKLDLARVELACLVTGCDSVPPGQPGSAGCRVRAAMARSLASERAEFDRLRAQMVAAA